MAPLTDAKIYRVDKFVAPESAREELLGRVRQTHRLLHDQPGFIHDLLLENEAGDGQFSLVTLVAWQDPDALAGAREAVRQMQQAEGFDPRELLARLGVTADLGTYSGVEPR